MSSVGWHPINIVRCKKCKRCRGENKHEIITSISSNGIKIELACSLCGRILTTMTYNPLGLREMSDKLDREAKEPLNPVLSKRFGDEFFLRSLRISVEEE